MSCGWRTEYPVEVSKWRKCLRNVSDHFSRSARWLSYLRLGVLEVIDLDESNFSGLMWMRFGWRCMNSMNTVKSLQNSFVIKAKLKCHRWLDEPLSVSVCLLSPHWWNPIEEKNCRGSIAGAVWRLKVQTKGMTFVWCISITLLITVKISLLIIWYLLHYS